MMRNDSNVILDDILSRWHFHCKHYSPVPVNGADPMFRNAVSPKGWDSTADIADDTVNTAQMKAVDFHVGEMQDPYRAAIHVLARNCYTGRSVWISPRLPADREERAVVVMQARIILTRRLMAAGMM
jgi:hypothetical protein